MYFKKSSVNQAFNSEKGYSLSQYQLVSFVRQIFI